MLWSDEPLTEVDGEVQTDEVDSKELIIRAAGIAEQDELADQQVYHHHYYYYYFLAIFSVMDFCFMLRDLSMLSGKFVRNVTCLNL